MVQGFMKSLVDKFIYQDRQTEDYDRTVKWLQDDPNSAYSSLYDYALNHYGQAAMDERQTIANYYNSELDKTSSSFSGMLSDLTNQYQTAQSGINSLNDKRLQQYEAYNSLKNQQIGNKSLQQYGKTAQAIEKALKEPTVLSDLNYGGISDAYKSGLTNTYNTSSSLYNEAYGLLSKWYSPDKLQNIQSQYQNLGNTYRSSYDAYKNMATQGQSLYGQKKYMGQGAASSRMAEFQMFNQGLSQAQQDVTGTLSSMNDYVNTLYNTAQNRESEERQKQLTFRNAYYANESSRAAGMRQRQSELLSGRAVANQRSTLNRSGQQGIQLSSQNLYR